MAGNEKALIEYLFSQRGKITLNHIGLLKTIEAPVNDKGDNYIEIDNIEDLKKVSTEDSQKKADIYLNTKGVSIKQIGGSFPFNRLQRAEIESVFKTIECKDIDEIINKIDDTIQKFHSGDIKGRNRPWSDFFSEDDFKNLTQYLMMVGSPNNGISSHPAQYILEAPSTSFSHENITVYTFEEYFNKYKHNLFIAIRRQWIGQSSDSEHNRSLQIAAKPGNKKWVFDNIAGSPRKHRIKGTIWREEIEEKDRKTVYMLFIEKT